MARRNGSDRGLWVAIGICAALGVGCLAVGVWGLLHPRSPSDLPYVASRSPVAGLVAGVIFLGFALAESLHRLRHGRQQPGRHSRSD